MRRVFRFREAFGFNPCPNAALSGERLASREKTYAYHSVIEPRGQKVCFTEFYGFAKRNRRHCRRSKTLRLSRKAQAGPDGAA